MNRTILMGRLTADPVLKSISEDKQVTTFSLAVQRRFAKEGQQQADFITCVAWGKTAEFICKYFSKGSMLAVDGRLQSRSWENDEGKKQYATEVVVESAYFTGGKKDQSTEEQQSPYPYTGTAQVQTNFTAPVLDTSFADMGTYQEDDLPF